MKPGRLSTVVPLVLLLCTQVLGGQSHFLKDVLVSTGEVISGDLMVYRGDLQVRGEVEGNVVVMFGDCLLEPEARIGGNLAIIQGELRLADRDQVGGKISQKDFLAAEASVEDDPFTPPAVPLEGFAAPESPGDPAEAGVEERNDDDESRVEINLYGGDDDDSELMMAFNRVAGLQLGLKFRSGKQAISRKKLFDLTGYAAWSFGQKRLEADAKLRKRMPWALPSYIALGLHRLTDTQDAWMLSGTENSLAGWLLHMDFRDYYDNQGYSIEAGAFLLEGRLHVNAAWFEEDYGPQELATQWTWSGAHRAYRGNLFAESRGYAENSNSGYRLQADLNMTRSRMNVKGGISLTLSYEQGLTGEPIEYDYTRWLGNFRFWLPFGKRRAESLNGRILAGAADGVFPAQYAFRLGGPDALAGYRPKGIDAYGSDSHDELFSFDGPGAPNMLLSSLEYQISGSALADWSAFWFVRGVDLLLLADAGQIFSNHWSDLDLEAFHSDIGVGLADDADGWRLALMRSTESGEADWRLLFRIKARF